MVRRQTKNSTGISRIENNTGHDAWVAYNCVNCNKLNKFHLGNELLTPKKAYEEAEWKCEYCNYVHSKHSDLPSFENWEHKYTQFGFLTVERFWEGFFRIYTEKPDSYWKQCNTCGLVLPFHAFSKHTKWGPLEKQMECRGCKGAINSILNPLRTAEQLHEGTINRRIGDLLLEGINETINQEDLFKRFNNKCFKTGVELDINDRSSWHIDHIMPSKFLYPLTKENAALLSKEANSNKRDKWPSDFYTNNELILLAKITGADLSLLSSEKPIINPNIDVNRGVERYLKVREHSNLNKRINELVSLLRKHHLIGKLSDENKSLLGLT